MSLRHTLPALLLVPAVAFAQSKDDFTALPADAKTPPAKMLYEALRAECQKHFDARRATIKAIQRPEQVKARQAELREKFVAAIGGFPAKTPLNPQVTGTLKRDGYRVEKVVYESRPHHHVTAALYLPDGDGPFPGVLVPCGHSVNGKAAEAYQRVCILMAKNGLAVLCYDPIGQGERVQLLDKLGKPAIAGSTSEHTMAGVGALLVGGSTAGYRIWDGIRSLDYLASRPEIDPDRLGCTGNSGGGTLTSYLMALDDRIKVAAPSCYITSLERLFATIGPQDAEQNITGQVAFGMDHADYLTLRAPRPTLVCVGTRDYFDIDGAWASFREAKRLYGVLGRGDCVDLFEYDDTHGFSKPRREAAMRWMRRWLLNKDDAPTEGNFPVEKDEALQVTRSGQVLEDFKGKSVFDLNRERAAELAADRAAFLTKHKPDAARAVVRKLIGLPETVPEAGLRAVTVRGVARFVYDTEPGVRVPALGFGSKRQVGTEPGPLIVYLHEAGKAAEAGPGAAIEKLVQAGNAVIAADLRGVGETAPGQPPGKRPNYFGTDSREAFLGLHLNRPLLGQRVLDVLSILKKSGGPKQEVHLVGVGSMGPVALHAAALDERVKSVTLERSVVSWEAVANSPVSHNQLANAVPGALAVYDLPQLAALVAPRKVVIRAATDPRGQPLPQAEVVKLYAGANVTAE
jgi:cephalosporin-C deacetylase-like acetyl esterase/pimeloyl-ACP methyl ester carboxylesterase